MHNWSGKLYAAIDFPKCALVEPDDGTARKARGFDTPFRAHKTCYVNHTVRGTS